MSVFSSLALLGTSGVYVDPCLPECESLTTSQRPLLSLSMRLAEAILCGLPHEASQLKWSLTKACRFPGLSRGVSHNMSRKEGTKKSAGIRAVGHELAGIRVSANGQKFTGQDGAGFRDPETCRCCVFPVSAMGVCSYYMFYL